MTFYKIGGLFPESTQNSTAVACNTLTWDFLFEWHLAELKRKLLIERRKLVLDCQSIVVAVISQWRRRLSAWHVSRLTVDILSTFCDVFIVHCVKLMLRIFWIWRFTVWLFCLSPKCNLSETFYQVWALRRWGGRHNHRQTHSTVVS